MFNEHSIFFGVRFFSTAASKSPNFYKKLPRTLLVIFAQFLTFRFSNCSLVALRVSSLCIWPPEAKWTLKKLSSSVWISSKTGKLFELVFWSLFLLSLFFCGRLFTCSLVALRASRRCTWPAETEQTLNRLNSLVWISSRNGVCS